MSKPPQILARSVAACLFAISVPSLYSQTNGTWSAAAGGSWSTATNWAGGTIPAGIGAIADFSTVDITAAATVTLDASRTVGTLRFQDLAASHDWTLATGTAGSILTLDVPTGQPTIDVSNRTATVTAVLTGTKGLAKTGIGTLVLNAANTFSGDVNLQGGAVNNVTLLRLSNAGALGSAANLNVNLGTTTGSQGTTLDLTGSITIGAGKRLTLNSASGDLRTTLLTSSGSNTWAGELLASGPGLTQLNAASGQTLTISGPITSAAGNGTGLLFVRGAGTVNINGVVTMGTDRIFNHTDAGTVVVNSTGNTWLSTQASDGQIQLGANDALANVEFQLGQGSATNGRFELNGFNQTITALRTNTASTGVNHVIRNSNVNRGSTLTFSTATGATDVLRNTVVQNVGQLTLVKNGQGRFELRDMRLDNTALNVNDGTLAFGGLSVSSRAAITTALAASVEQSGTGTTNLAGVFKSAGTTNVSAGRLNLSNGSAGTISVAAGATLGTGLGNGTLKATSVTFANGGTFAAILPVPGSAPRLNAATLTTGGANTPVIFEGAGLVAGTYPLISYVSAGGSGIGGFVLGPAGSNPHSVATLVNNAAANRLDLNIASVDSLVWTGATDANWNVNATSNFKLASNGSAAPFFQGDAVLFNDTATNTTITTTEPIRIGNLTFDNSAVDYTVTGVLAGSGGITKNGDATLTLGSANTFTGPINVNKGTLVLNGIQSGTSAVNITGGTLRFGTGVPDALTSGASVVISNGGTLDVNGQGAFTYRIPQIRVSGAGVNDAGAIINSGANIVNLNHALNITLDGNTTWGGSGRYDVTPPTVFNGGAFTLTKVGGGELWFGPAPGSSLGNVVVNGGIFGSQTANPLPATSTVTINSGAIHSIFSAVPIQHQVVLNDFGTLRSTNSTPSVNGNVTLNGTDSNRNIQATNNTTLFVNGRVTGTGGFQIADAGIVQFRNAANNYAGDTVLNGTTGANTTGTLNFGPFGSIPTTTNLIINTGNFDPSNLTHTVASLSGSGGNIVQAVLGSGVLNTTQSSITTYSGLLTRATLRMSGTGSVTLAGTADNSGGLVEANAGTVVFAKTGDYGAHTVGSGGVALTINSGGTVQLAGSLTGTTGGSTSNNPPADLSVTAPPPNYVDQIFNLSEVVLNTGGTLDLNGRIEAIDGLAGGGKITNTSTTPGRLYVGYNNMATGFVGNTSTFSGVIQDGAGPTELSVIGTSNLVLAGANTYTGATSVNSGTLTLNGSLGNTAVTVANGATMRGPGNLGGSLTLNGNATFTGNGSIGGNLAVNNTAVFTGSGPIGGSVAVTGTYNGGGNITGGLTGNAAAVLNIGGISGGATATTVTAGTVNFPASATRTMNVDFTGTAADRITVTAPNGLTLNGTTNVTVSPGAAGWVTGSYPIFGYNGAVQGTGASSLVLQTAAGHSTVQIVDSGSGLINLQVTGVGVKWVGNSGNNWDVNATSNWSSPDQKFLNGDGVVFDDTATNKTPSIAANVTPASVGFNTAAATYVLSGGAGISGSGSLTKQGTGTVTLRNPNTYTGPTSVQQGTLVANYNAGAPVVVIAAGSPINVATAAFFKAVADDADITIANPLSGAGTVTLDPHAVANAASRTVTLSGNNLSFTGTLALSPTSGTFRLAGTTTAANLGTGPIVISDGGQLWTAANQVVPNNITITGSGFSEPAGGTAGGIGSVRMENGTLYSGNITVTGTAKIGAYNGTTTVSGNLTGGSLSLGGNNAAINETFLLTGNAGGLTDLTVNSGNSGGGTTESITVSVGNGGTTGTLGAVPITINGDAKLAVLRFDTSNGYMLGSAITSAGTTANTRLQIDTRGTGFNSNGLAINLGGGALQVGATRTEAVASINSALTAGSIIVGALNATVTTRTAKASLTLASGAVVNTNSITVAGGGSGLNTGNTNASVINFATGSTTNVTGTFFIGDQNSSGGIVNQNGGDVSVGNHIRVGHWPNETSVYNLGGGSLTLTGAAGGSPYTTGATEVSGGIYLGIDGTGVFNQTGGTLSTNWIVADNRGNSGPGTNQPTGVDTYTISGGTLNIKSSFGLISRNATAAFNLNGGTIVAQTDFNLDSNRITVGGVTTIETGGLTVTALGPLSGAAGGLVVAGGGTFRTTDSPTLESGTNVPFGGGSLGSASMTLNAGTTLNADRTGTDTWSGVLTGAGALSKTNTGTLTLTGNSAPTFTGATTVAGGSLLVNGSVAGSTVTVSGGTLGGSGRVGAINLTTGALAPGDGTGILNAGSTTMSGGSLRIELASAGTAGTNYDQLKVTGTVTLGNNIDLELTLGDAFVYLFGSAFTLIDNDGTDALAGTGRFRVGGAPIADNVNFPFAGSMWQLDYNGGDGNDLVLLAVPEPGAVASLFAATGALLGLRRLRRIRSY